jgi:nucleotide-binding universal stress UspA family protein
MKIMVTLDGSEFAEAVIGPAARLAKDAKAQVYLVQVVGLGQVHGTVSGSPETAAEAMRAELAMQGTRVPSSASHLAEPRTAESLGQALDRAVQTAKDYLVGVAQSFAPLKPEPVALVGDDVDAALLKFAKEHQIDLIAMASHGRTGLARVVMGSHTARMLGQRIAPVMMVRPDHLLQAEEPVPPRR